MDGLGVGGRVNYPPTVSTT